MSGHSKWNNIMHKKGKTDAQRAKIFTKIGKEMIMAAKNGGANPETNAKLRDVIAKAKANNVPNDNIERTLKKAAGAADTSNYENITYEGYGPSGVAVIVETMTDNRNRTAGEIRHYFDKFGGNLGQTGSVGWMFKQKGIIVIESGDIDEETIMMQALDAGADDFSVEENVFEIETAPENFTSVREALEKEGYEFLSAQVEMVPDTYAELTDEDDIKHMQLLLEHLEENDDVNEVWHNWDE